jgi:(p)ppGpp synthase/HD superfamily hydrolase
MHAGQRRGDGAPFILHPLEVAALLYQAGAPDQLIAAGVLHDVLEKTSAAEEDLRRAFGLPVTRLVLAVTDDDRITGYAKRKAALRRQVSVSGDEALMLFAADKLSKVRELRREPPIDSKATSSTGRRRQLRTRRLKHYQRSLAMLEERLPDSPIVAQLRDELRVLSREHPALAAARSDLPA